MTTIYHQFAKTTFYTPNWKINHLFLGTFNPSATNAVNYYYGRKRNNTWRVLSEIFGNEFDPSRKRLFFKMIKANGIACMDLIHKIQSPKNRLCKILGEGFSDSALFNKSIKLKYNTKRILRVIKCNPEVKLYSTWGRGPQHKAWNNEVSNFHDIIRLVSPSSAAKVPKGEKKFNYVLSDWEKKIRRKQTM
jgi:G:T/U-mismatch repair DNA glycosylase